MNGDPRNVLDGSEVGEGRQSEGDRGVNFPERTSRIQMKTNSNDN